MANHEPGSWQWAKAEAFRIAPTIGARIGQSADGTGKTVAVGGRVHQCATWLAVYTLVAAIAADKRPPRTVREMADVMAATRAPVAAVSQLARVTAERPGGPPSPVADAVPVAQAPTAADFVGLMVCVKGGRWAGRHVHVKAVAPCGRLDCQCDDDGSRVLLPLERLTG